MITNKGLVHAVRKDWAQVCLGIHNLAGKIYLWGKVAGCVNLSPVPNCFINSRRNLSLPVRGFIVMHRVSSCSLLSLFSLFSCKILGLKLENWSGKSPFKKHLLMSLLTFDYSPFLQCMRKSRLSVLEFSGHNVDFIEELTSLSKDGTNGLSRAYFSNI